jgi:hypothetical protein
MLTAQSNMEFNRARQRAFIEEWLSYLTGRPSQLLSFEEVRQNLRLQDSAYKGLQEIELDKIVGSTGRYRDFTRTFLPKSNTTAERWRRVDAVAHDQGFPPIEVYQVGDVYFVRDGNHRVSVARTHDAKTIEAYVIEYKTEVSIDTQDDLADITSKLDGILLDMERTEFLKKTRLDEIQPDHGVCFTEPGRYRLVEEHIGFHKYLRETETNRELSYEEAVASWYDQVYLPVIQLIRERDVLNDFPDRTEADLYTWLLLHRAELEGETRMLGYISNEELLDDLTKDKNTTPLTRLIKFFSPKLDLQNLSLKAERVKFLEETQLNRLRPDHHIHFTEPGCYHLAQEHIRVHKYLRETELSYELSYEAAVTSWYDHVYLPVIELIREHDVLKYFPNNTEGDLYIWLISRRAALEGEKQAMGQISTEEILEELEQENLASPITRLISSLRQALLNLNDVSAGSIQ